MWSKIILVLKKAFNWGKKINIVIQLIKRLFAIFGKSDNNGIIHTGPTVVSTRTETVDGKTYLIEEYSDGTSKRKPINESDPTGVGDFLDDIGRMR
jgi:hypothetical protein